MKTRIAVLALGLIAAAPAYAEVMRDTGGVTAPSTGGVTNRNTGGVTSGTGRGIIMNSDGRGITTGSGAAVTGNGRSGVRGLNGGNSDVIRMNPSVSLEGATGTNAVNRAQGGVKAGVGNSIQADGLTGTNAVNGTANFGVSGTSR